MTLGSMCPSPDSPVPHPHISQVGNSNLGEGASSWAPGILFSESVSLFYTESLSPGILPTCLSGLWPSLSLGLCPLLSGSLSLFLPGLCLSLLFSVSLSSFSPSSP